MIFETHAHYDDEQFDEDREQLLAGLQEAGIETVVNVGATLRDAFRRSDLQSNIHLSMRQSVYILTKSAHWMRKNFHG